MWDIYKAEHELCHSRIDDYYHRESVTQMKWITHKAPPGYNDVYSLATISTDGKILLWNEREKLKHPAKGHFMATKSGNNLNIVGGKSLT